MATLATIPNGPSAPAAAAMAVAPTAQHKKLHGRAFYESIGSPKYIVAPMVDQSEFIWRMLSRSFLPESERSSMLAYTPMFHARLFAESQRYRDSHFEPMRDSIPDIQPDPVPTFTPHLDGNPAIDRPLFVQFCANDPETLLAAAKLVVPYCDAVDLNLGCPQGIAKKGHYGSFLQEDQTLIYKLINILHENLSIPVTAKIRILETKEATLEYAKNVLRAGASILTVHGRRREQKGHITGLADWNMIRYLRDNLPAEAVLFANGNILQHGDLAKCLAATGADGVMSAEGNLSNPGIFAVPPPVGEEPLEYWRGKDGRGGWRVDAVFRRYLDLIHQYVRGKEPPKRRPLFVPGDDTKWMETALEGMDVPPLSSKTKTGRSLDKRSSGKTEALHSPNYVGVQAHLFHLLRHLVSVHHDVRNALARSKMGDISVYENILEMVERKVAEGLIEYEKTDGQNVAADDPVIVKEGEGVEEEVVDDIESSVRTVRECKRPWWAVQPIIRPLPKEALAKGAIQPKGKKQQHAPNGNGEQQQAKDKKRKDKENKKIVASVVAAAACVAGATLVAGAEQQKDGTGASLKRKFDDSESSKSVKALT